MFRSHLLAPLFQFYTVGEISAGLTVSISGQPVAQNEIWSASSLERTRLELSSLIQLCESLPFRSINNSTVTTSNFGEANNDIVLFDIFVLFANAPS